MIPDILYTPSIILSDKSYIFRLIKHPITSLYSRSSKSIFTRHYLPMDLRETILKEHSKANTLGITQWVGNKQDRFDLLMDLFLADEYRVVQRAAWVVSECAIRNPALILPHLGAVLTAMETPVHDAVLRNSLKVLAELDLPEEHMGKAVSISFDLLAHPKSPVAIKVHAMQVIANLCVKEPDLSEELKLLIEDQWEEGTAGFKSRGKRILKQLEKIKKT